MRAARTVGMAGRVNQRTPKRFRWNADVKCRALCGNNVWPHPCCSDIGGTREGDGVRSVVIPGSVDDPVRSHKGHCADRAARAAWIVSAHYRETGAMVPRCRYPNATASEAPRAGAPGEPRLVPKRPARLF